MGRPPPITFTVRSDIRFDTEHGLGAAGVHAETGYYLIKNNGCLRCGSNIPNFLKEIYRLKFRPSALHGFYEHRRQFMCPFTYYTQAFIRSIFKNQHILNRLGLNSGRRRKSFHFLGTPYQGLIVYTVVSSRECHN